MAGVEQHREHVLRPLAGSAAIVDLGVDEAVHGVAGPSEAGVRAEAPEALAVSRGFADAGDAPNWSTSANRPRRASRRSPASRPNTARRMISSVSAWKRGWSWTGSRSAKLATSRSASSSMSPESRCILSPWKAGSISFRCSM